MRKIIPPIKPEPKTNEIIIEGYTIESEHRALGRFNVYKHTIVASGKTKGTEVKRNIAWAITLQRTVKLIAEDKLWSEDRTLFLNQYMDEKIEVMNDIVSELIEAFDTASEKFWESTKKPS